MNTRFWKFLSLAVVLSLVLAAFGPQIGVSIEKTDDSLIVSASVDENVMKVLAWHADGVDANVQCIADSANSTYNVVVDQSEEWPGASIVGHTGSETSGTLTPGQTVGGTVTVGWPNSSHTKDYDWSATGKNDCVAATPPSTPTPEPTPSPTPVPTEEPVAECSGTRIEAVPPELQVLERINSYVDSAGNTVTEYRQPVTWDSETHEICEYLYSSSLVPPAPTPEPTPSPTAPAPTPEPALKDEKQKLPAPPAVCVEIDVKTVVRTDPNTGFQTIVRVWIDSLGKLLRDLDLFERFPNMKGKVLSQDIQNSTGCWVYFVFLPEGEELAQIWRVSSMGETMQQIANGESGPFSQIATAFNGVTAYTDDGVVKVAADAKANNAESTGAFADQLEFAGNNDLFARNGDSLMSFETEMVFDITRGGFALMPDGEGFYFMDGPFAVPFYFAEGLDTENHILAKELTLSPYPDDQRKLLGLFEQVWLKSPQRMTQISDGMSAINDLFDGQWWETPTYSQPDWWVTKDLRVVYNSSAINLASQVAEENNGGGITQPEPAPICAGYQGNSLVECLTLAGVENTSFEARAWLAADNGIADYTGTAEQNIALLNILRGTGD